LKVQQLKACYYSFLLKWLLPVIIAAGGFAACGFLLFLQLLVFQRLVKGGILQGERSPFIA
jgi:hypothetical protein